MEAKTLLQQFLASSRATAIEGYRGDDPRRDLRSHREPEIQERQGRVHIRGKGNRERYVPLNTTARRALHAYLHAREATGTQDPVFLSETGTALSIRSIQSLITELARRAHLSRIPVSAHTLRHTFALGYLKENPGKLVELATLLGHESLDTTAIYSLPSEEDLAAEVERSSYNIDA